MIKIFFLEVNKETGRLSIGSHRGTLEDSAVYSGGSSEVLSKLIGAKGRCCIWHSLKVFKTLIYSIKEMEQLLIYILLDSFHLSAQGCAVCWRPHLWRCVEV